MARKPKGAVPQMTNRFDKGANTDIRDYHLDKQSWTHARNAINNTHIGDLGDVGNEPSNDFCASAPYKIIGVIHMVESKWWIYSGDDADGSEIGIFDKKDCSYTTVANDSCLNFRSTHPITGASRATFDCGYQSYWQDNLNTDRSIQSENVPWVQNCVTVDGCTTCTDTDVLDCDKIRLESFMGIPCPTISRGPSGGSVFNGSYYVHISYVVNSQRVTDWFPMSNVVHIFDHDEPTASLDININGLDTETFDEYQVALVAIVANKQVQKILGTYSTAQDKITIDLIDPDLTAVSYNELVTINPIFDRSEGMFSVGKYLFRTGVTGKFDFNYQPLANQITTKWQAVEYPEDYYKGSGTNVGFMRDENYAFFVRFRYTTGDVTPSYHIPGRAARPYVTPDGSGTMDEDDDYVNVNNNNLEQIQGLTSKVFEMFNTASATIVNISLPDGGTVVAEGDMGYHESDELYPDQKPEVWNSDVQGHPEFDLCGKPIRHHKFPENSIYSGASTNNITNHYADGEKIIRIMGVAFDNIQPPVDNYGDLIPNIEGYEILRGSRDGNKTVVYKGLINNMRETTLPPQLAINRTGLYPNYPFNSVAHPDAFVSVANTSYDPGGGSSGPASNPTSYIGYLPNPEISQKNFTFHSPDTMFYSPFLAQKELKIYGASYGKAVGQYVKPDKHPKHVFVTDVSFFVGLIVGVGLAVAKTVGTKTVSWQKPGYYSEPVFFGGSNSPGTPTGAGTASAMSASFTTADNLNKQLNSILSAISGVDLTGIGAGAAETANRALNALPGQGTEVPGVTVTYDDKTGIPDWMNVIQGVNLFATNISEGADLTMDLIRNMSKPRQHALQYLAHCGYENFAPAYTTNKRRIIDEANYLGQHLQDYKDTHRINNILRSKTVAFNTTVDVENLVGTLVDDTMSKILASDLGLGNETDPFARQASSHYVAFKSRLRSQYGAIETVQQVPASTCLIPISETSTGTIFGGDTYIGRYQEKNTFYHFYNWLYDQKDRAEFNYHLYDAVQHAAFWMDTEPFDTMEFVQSFSTALQTSVSGGGGFFTNLVTPSDKHCFDRVNDSNPLTINGGWFAVKNAYMYLFHSSVRDFFVESELNIDMRDWEDDSAKKHYGVLQDLAEMFHMQRIKQGNFYKLDKGVSVQYMPFNKLSWSKVQDREYDPTLAETCYQTFDKRLIYSLPQSTALKKDNWSSFLANNYKDFESKVTAIKAIRSTGIMLLFENHSPGMYPGVDELQLESGTSITVGDGGLFTRQMQTVTNVDEEIEFGSCQSRRSIVNTPAGTFYISQDQGKIFQFGKGLQEISLKNNKHWFNQYLPYQLIKDFPEYDLLDNPIAGIGCQTVYDNEFGLLYFCKRDFRVKPEYINIIEYVGDGEFIVDGITRVKTGDPVYFDDASWTVSYDPKNGEEISWHDWHPNLVMSSENSFLTVKGQSMWKHNSRCDSYCNFYGTDYPFEIEFQVNTPGAVTTLNNIEYYLQAFIFGDNCRDRYHALDFNFDEAVIYNSEQVSGLLRLTLQPKNDVNSVLNYPIIGLNDIEILYSKEEQKYRFNQFWDVTRDRGEFSPLVNETIWLTEPNGYIKNLNATNLDYAKEAFQRKKFRHDNNRILLRRNISGNKKILLLMNNTKIQISPR
jgi:hypothetical protein